MSGRMELGLPKMSAKEQLLRKTLHNVRSQGHPYVELRKEGKKLIFFCTLCLARCYGDSNLMDHLKGSGHAGKLATAQVTLLKPNPWPFSDGVFFFNDETDKENESSTNSYSEDNKLRDVHRGDADSLAIVNFGENLASNAAAHVLPEIEDHGDCDEIPCESHLNGDGSSNELVIPAVLQKDEVSELVVKHMGVGLIGARFTEKDGVSNGIHRIWCEWLGNDSLANDDVNVVPEHDFAVVTFAYSYNLGRRSLFDAFRYLLPSSRHSEAEDSGSCRGRKRKSFSDPENISEALRNQDDSSGDESQSSNKSTSKMLLSGNDDQLIQSRIVSSKTLRKKMREQDAVASERSCAICQQKMLPNKDVGALLNMKTGKLVCSSRNSTGAFHMFHISCLIHWILLCEVENHARQSAEPKVKKRSRRKAKGNNGQNGANHGNQNFSAFCPECQGTGVRTVGEELEKPTVPLKDIFWYKIKLINAHKAWMKSPELLQNCSTGFTFPLSDEIYQEYVSSLKMLHFYRASA